MDEMLRALVGRQVQVFSVRGETEVSDSGVLEAYDNNWLCIRKGGEALYFSIHRVRLIKPI